MTGPKTWEGWCLRVVYCRPVPGLKRAPLAFRQELTSPSLVRNGTSKGRVKGSGRMAAVSRKCETLVLVHDEDSLPNTLMFLLAHLHAYIGVVSRENVLREHLQYME